LLVGLTASLTLCSLTQAADYFLGGDTTATDEPQIADSGYIVDTLTNGVNSGALDSAIGWFNANFKGPHSVAFIVYNSDSTILDSTAYFTVTSSSRVRYSASFIEGATLAASTQYFIGFHCASEGGTDGNLKYYNNTSASAISAWYKYPGVPVIEAPMTGPNKDTNNRPKAIGVYFSDDATEPAKKFNVHLGNVKI